ncbi:MAG TPA: hypothetical protein VN971_09425, partial [Thermoanaerobaculia bacterium]|nr:hypothetical protein [Thermoanaerobaculia bacterium]
MTKRLAVLLAFFLCVAVASAQKKSAAPVRAPAAPAPPAASAPDVPPPVVAEDPALSGRGYT